MKAVKAFIKPFEAPQRSANIKTQVKFLSSPGSGREGFKSFQKTNRRDRVDVIIQNNNF